MNLNDPGQQPDPSAFFYDTRRTTRQGDAAIARLLVVDSQNGDGIRTNVVELGFGCSTWLYTILRVDNFDSAHRPVPSPPQAPPEPSPVRSAGNLIATVFNAACLNVRRGDPIAGSDVQSHATRYFAGSRPLGNDPQERRSIQCGNDVALNYCRYRSQRDCGIAFGNRPGAVPEDGDLEARSNRCFPDQNGQWRIPPDYLPLAG